MRKPSKDFGRFLNDITVPWNSSEGTMEGDQVFYMRAEFYFVWWTILPPLSLPLPSIHPF